jgi:tRNA-dihydrouridine synthase
MPIRDPFLEPLGIGALRLERRLLMAPMAGITTRPFRAAVRRWGAGLVFTEMISAYGVHYGNCRTLDYLTCRRDEHPIGYQLFGADAGVLAEAAERCVDAGADLVDLNMACPVRKVMRTGAGAALLGEPERAVDIVKATVSAVGGRVPVTVKIRTGLREGDGRGAVWRPASSPPAQPRCVSTRERRRSSTAAARSCRDCGAGRDLPVPVIASGDVDGRATALALLGRGAAA